MGFCISQLRIIIWAYSWENLSYAISCTLKICFLWLKAFEFKCAYSPIHYKKKYLLSKYQLVHISSKHGTSWEDWWICRWHHSSWNWSEADEGNNRWCEILKYQWQGEVQILLWNLCRVTQVNNLSILCLVPVCKRWNLFIYLHATSCQNSTSFQNIRAEINFRLLYIKGQLHKILSI